MTRPQTPCEHCGALKNAAFFICRACWREVPFELRARYHGVTGLAHHKLKTPGDVTEVEKRILGHLKLYSSAL